MKGRIKTSWFDLIIGKQERRDGYWTTADGEVLHVSEMKTSHLANTINFLERRARAASQVSIPNPWAFPEPQGEMAQDAYYQACERYDEYGHQLEEELYRRILSEEPIYAMMVAELERRIRPEKEPDDIEADMTVLKPGYVWIVTPNKDIPEGAVLYEAEGGILAYYPKGKGDAD